MPGKPQTAPETETYLGDGLYVSFLHGFQIRLRAPRIEGDHIVYMESGELAAFLAWLKNTGIASNVLR